MTLLIGSFLAALLSSPGMDQTHPGKKFLLSSEFTTPSFTLGAYQSLWKSWGLAKPPSPEEFSNILSSRYGLHRAPYENHGLPMGLKMASFPLTLGTVQGIAMDCLICHGGLLDGKPVIGLGNNSLDLQTFFEDFHRAEGNKGPMRFRFSNTKGTNEAGAVSVFLAGFRNPDLSLKPKWENLGLRDVLCEDVPPWWNLKKKKTMYFTGGADARSVRSIMQFMMSPINPPAHFEKNEVNFAKLQQFMHTLTPPKYPFPIDQSLALLGNSLFKDHCSKCHGTYGPNGVYPNKIVALKEIGTDPARFLGISREFALFYNSSWFSKEKQGWAGDEYKARDTEGYQAPPLDGIWATAPYFHNGSVPSLLAVLKPQARPKRFQRDFENRLDQYDRKNLGWGFTQPPGQANPGLDPLESRKIYDTTLPGRSNQGHLFGEILNDAQRYAILEYLKTL
ncbi:MAG: c-type cytochrome [Gemmataceae bacterium]|nr:c-type cytochrome [Gemmataceae bacterium]